MNLESNIRGQLRIYRSNTFSNPYVFFGEALQNAQRAKATRVDIQVERDKIIVQDNGPGLDDPQSLFTLASSGWDEQTKEEQDPFGIGFFSSLALAGNVCIESRGRKYTLNYDQLMQGDSLEVPEEDSEVTEGFKVTLTELIPEYEYWSARNQATDLSKTVLDLDVYLNGSKVSQVNPLIPPEDRPYVQLALPDIKGWLAIARYSWEASLKVYHSGRYVKDFQMYGVDGAISITNKALNLRAPDRRDFIQDELYQKFQARLEKAFRTILFKRLSSGERLGVDESYIIQKYITPGECASALSFTAIRPDFDLDTLDQFEEDQLKGLSITDIEGLVSQAEYEEPVVEEAEFTSSVQRAFTARSEAEPHEVKARTDAPPTLEELETEAQDQLRHVDKTKGSKDLAKSLRAAAKKKRLFYAEPTDLKRHKDEIKGLLQIGATVVIARNELEAKSLKEGLQAAYAGSISQETITRVSFKGRENPPLTQRVCRLVDRLLKFYNVNLVPVPGVLSQEVEVLVAGARASLTKGPISFAVDPNRVNNYLYVSTQAEKARILRSYDERADIGELLYILKHIRELSEATGLSPVQIAEGLATIRTGWMVSQMAEEAE